MTTQLPATPMADFFADARKHHVPVPRSDAGFLKFNGKTGQWTYGAEDTVIDEKDLVLVNVVTLEHGWVRWGEVPPAKVFTRINQPMPKAPEPLDGIDPDTRQPKTFNPSQARQFAGAFIDGGDQFVFNTNSMGGVERADDLFIAVMERAAVSPFCFPRVSLTSDWYKRATGKVYKPLFKVIGWCDTNGNDEGTAQLPPATNTAVEEPAETPRRRRRFEQ